MAESLAANWDLIDTSLTRSYLLSIAIILIWSGRTRIDLPRVYQTISSVLIFEVINYGFLEILLFKNNICDFIVF